MCLVVAALLLMGSGCIPRFDPETMQLRSDGPTAPVYGSYSVGQTFTATHAGLTALELDLAQGSTFEGPLVLHLRDAPASSDFDTTGIVHLPQDGSPVVWRFPPLANSAGRRFYLQVDAPQASEQNPVKLSASYHDVYTPGTLFVDGEVAPGDLSFRTYYDYGLAELASDMLDGLSAFRLILPALLLFVAPGYLLLRTMSRTGTRFDAWERVALAMGVSLAVFPVVLLWVTNLGARFSEPAARIVFGGLGGIALVTMLKDLPSRGGWVRPRRRALANRITVALVLGLGLAVRLIAVRDLDFPPWVDSVHHVLVAHIIADSGQIPLTYRPYVPVDQASYHYGFQSLVAAFTWVSGLTLTQATVLVGQLFNAGMALQTYLLTRRLTGRSRAAVLAAFIVALLSTMPAFYVNWGRYTELDGLLILPAAFTLSITAVQERNWRLGGLAVLAAAGLLATHYRVFAFFLCLMGAWWLVQAAQARRWRLSVRHAAGLAAIIAMATTLLMPWIGRVASDLWWRGLTEWGAVPSSANWDFGWEYVTGGFDRYLLVIGVTGAVVALLKRRWFSAILAVWLVLLFVVTNPSLLHLPGEGLFDNVTMLIVWFLPLSIWCGWLADELARVVARRAGARGRTIFYALAAVLLVVVSAFGIYGQITIVRPTSILALQEDSAALEWLNANTPPDSRVLINAQPWDAYLYAGTDGGYWVAPLANRVTTTPPALYGLADLDEQIHVREFNRRMADVTGDSNAIWALLREEGVTYVYVGAVGGPLDPDVFRTSPDLRTAYDNGRAAVFRVEEP